MTKYEEFEREEYSVDAYRRGHSGGRVTPLREWVEQLPPHLRKAYEPKPRWWHWLLRKLRAW